jgi:hypothetical protein
LHEGCAGAFLCPNGGGSTFTEGRYFGIIIGDGA